MSSSDRGWDSIPKRFIYTQDRLSLEGWLLGKAFDKFLKTIPVKHMMPFRMEFISQRFAPAANNCVGDGIPDMSVIFGAVAPVESVVYQSSCHLQSRSNLDMSICFDTGCSMSSTFSIDDFEEPPTKGNFGQLRTITNVVPIVAAGMIRWQVHDRNGNTVFIRVPGYYIPSSSQRLFSPQNYARYHQWQQPDSDCYGGNDKHFWMKLASDKKGEVPEIQMEISVLDGLPYMQAIPIDKSTVSNCSACVKPECHECQHAFHLNVLSEQNDNLSSAQKVLLLDHQRLGHIHIDHLRTLYRCGLSLPSIDDTECKPCLVPKHVQVQACSVPMCLACRVAKARKLPRNTGRVSTVDSDQQSVLTRNQLIPGQRIFVDQYESSARGRLSTSKGQEQPSQMFCGGTLFYDAASHLIQVCHQVSLGGSDTLRSKNLFEREALHCGVQIQQYQSDNGVFTKSQF